MTIARALVNMGSAVGLAVALTCSAQTAPASAPSPTTQPVPTPARVMSKPAAELLAKAQAAAKAVNDVAADVESSNGETTSKGKVVFVLQDTQIPFGNWRIEPAAATGVATGKVVAYDGAAVRTIDPKKKQMTELPAKGVGMPSGDAGSIIPMWFMDQRSDRFAGAHLQVVEQVIEDETGAQKIGDENVAVVRQIREAKLSAEQGGGIERTITETVRVSLAADNLARRYEHTFEVTGEGGQKQVTRQTYTNVKINQSPAAETYRLNAPEGYTTRTLDPRGPNLSVSEGDPAIEFSLKDAEGKQYSLADFKGKIVLMDFWATWCGPCKQAMPSVQKIHEAFKDKAVTVIGVDTWERDAAAGPAYIKDKGYTYLNLFKGDELTKAYEIQGIPTMLLIDKDGKILRILVGFSEAKEEELKQLIDEKLK